MRISDWSSDVCSSDLYKYRDHETSQTYAGVTVAGVSAPASLFDPSGAGGNYLSGFDGVNDQMTGRFKIDGGAMVDYVEGGDWLAPGASFPVPSMFAAAEFTAGNWDGIEKLHAVRQSIVDGKVVLAR